MKTLFNKFKIYFIAGFVILGLLSLWLTNKYLISPKVKAKKADEKKEKKSKDEEQEEESLPRVKGFKIYKRNFQDILKAIGTVQGASKIELRFETNGMVKSFNFRPGDLVVKGEIIAELNHTESELKIKFREAKLQSAKADLMALQNKVETHEKLYKIGAIIKSKLDEVKLGYEKALQELKAAQIELESAKAELQKTYMISPKNGVLGQRKAETGEYVTTTVKVATLVDISEVLVEVGIIEKDLDKIQRGQFVRIQVDTYPDKEFFGEVDNIPSTIDTTRTLVIKCRIPNPENLLFPGMFSRVWITVFDAENIIIIPFTSLYPIPTGGYKTYVIGEDSVIQERIITVGYMTQDDVEVQEGLKVGEMIVDQAQQELQNGAKVEVVEVIEPEKEQAQPQA
ncbi:efflux RND transporter periplasmic adaptor subunit [Candidatus Auribacterota bacterium]